MNVRVTCSQSQESKLRDSSLRNRIKGFIQRFKIQDSRFKIQDRRLHSEQWGSHRELFDCVGRV